MALQRQSQRTFVIPVLLREGCKGALASLGLDPQETLYLDATDLSDAGIAASARTLAEELFKHCCSMLVETLRNADRRRLLDDWAGELTEFQQAAFRWRASMQHSLTVLSGNSGPSHMRATRWPNTNRVADRFIRAWLHRDRITAAWHDRRSLCAKTYAIWWRPWRWMSTAARCSASTRCWARCSAGRQRRRGDARRDRAAR